MNNKEYLEEKINLKDKKLKEAISSYDELKREIYNNKVYLPIAIGASISLVSYLLGYVYNIDNTQVDYQNIIGLYGTSICMPTSLGISMFKYIKKCKDKEQLIILGESISKYKEDIGKLLFLLNGVNKGIEEGKSLKR